MNRVLAAAVFVVVISEGLLLAQGYGGVGFPGGGGKGMGSLAAAFCSLTGCTMTGQIVSSAVSVDWTSGTNEDLVFTPNGTGQCTCGTSFTGLAVSADAVASAGETWASFTTSDAPSGVGSISFGNVSTTNATVDSNIYMISAGGATRKNFIQAMVPASDDTGSVPVLAIQVTNTAGGSIANRELVSIRAGSTEVLGVYTSGTYSVGAHGINGKLYTQAVSPTALSGTTSNYAGCTHTMCRLDPGASARDLTGIVPFTGGTQHHLCNIGTQDIVLKHDVTSSAANRFTFNGSTDRTIAPAECFSVIYDGTTARWRELK